MNKTPRRYEKVDAHTIKIIIEKSDKVPVAGLIENKEKLEVQRAIINETIANIDEILAKAKALGITPAPKDNKIVPIPKNKPIKEGRGEKPNTQKPSDVFRNGGRGGKPGDVIIKGTPKDPSKKQCLE